MGLLSQRWVWARLSGHTVPSPGLAGCLCGFHPQLAEDWALWVSRPLPNSPSWAPIPGRPGKEKDPI